MAFANHAASLTSQNMTWFIKWKGLWEFVVRETHEPQTFADLNFPGLCRPLVVTDQKKLGSWWVMNECSDSMNVLTLACGATSLVCTHTCTHVAVGHPASDPTNPLGSLDCDYIWNTVYRSNHLISKRISQRLKKAQKKQSKLLMQEQPDSNLSSEVSLPWN